MPKCIMCGYDEKVSNTLQATVMNKFQDQHGNKAIFNKPNDLKSFETVQDGEKFVWTKIETGDSKSIIKGQAINSKQAEVLKEINDSKSGTMGGLGMPILATATPEGVSPANAKAPVQTVGVVQPFKSTIIQPPTQ